MKTLYTFTKEHLLSSLTLKTSRTRGRSEVLTPVSETEEGNVITLTYDCGAFERLAVTAQLGEESVLFSIDASVRYTNGASNAFLSENAVSFTLGDAVPDALLASHHDGPWWMLPSFPESFSVLRPRTQSLLVKLGTLHYHLLPLTGENFRCEMEAGKMNLTSDMAGGYRLKGAFLSVSVSTEPLAAVEANYRGAKALGGITVPLRTERVLPAHFRKFGWCTWDSFYRDVSSERIYQKLQEFRDKGIAVKWMIIDDGWLTTNGSKLKAFSVDREKFPEGLKAAVDKIKGEYGVEKVGVWHAYNGYWEGVDMESDLYREQKDNLTVTVTGYAVPSLDEDKAFQFWDAWHTYLAESGIDFLKVDNQSSNSAFLEGTMNTAEACRISHRAIERSIEKNFGGAVIDCMGMDMENVLARPMSAVSRNSDDFFPRRERGFIKHLNQNVYNAIWHNQMYVCDFDMWWSDHESAIQSGVLRAISGSPVYVSDEVGKSRAEAISPVVESDGTVMMCDYAARPTDDCVYTDCVKEKKLLKVWNRAGDAFALAAFNVSDEEVTDTVDFAGIPELPSDTPYVAYEYFTKKFTLISRQTDFALTLPKDGLAVWSVYPVIFPDETTQDGAYILCGSTEKYVPIASQYRVKLTLDQILG